jgi:hypothetical protein
VHVTASPHFHVVNLTLALPADAPHLTMAQLKINPSNSVRISHVFPGILVFLLSGQNMYVGVSGCLTPALFGACCREHMTDVVIQHLTTEQKVRIQCHDYVKKLAVYKDCLAVQLPKRITVYQLKAGADATDMRYKPVNVIEQELECNLLVVTAHHLTLCQVCPLLSHVFKGLDHY